MTYYNTTHESGNNLTQFELKASSQEQMILDFFRRHPGEMFTPSDIWVRLHSKMKRAPLTSIRRAITNLTGPGGLEKTDLKTMGPYGRPEYYWRAESDT